MARLTVDTEARLKVHVPRGYQGFWDIIRSLREFTISDIHGRCNTHRASIRDFVGRLERAGIVARTDEVDATGAVSYTLIRDQPEAPRLRRDGTPARETGRGQEQMWRAMKMLPAFTARDIAIHASTEHVAVRETAAASYLRHLVRAGYLTLVEPARPGHKPGTGRLARYRLIPAMNTGPLAPQIQRTQWVWDPNKACVVGPEADTDSTGESS